MKKLFEMTLGWEVDNMMRIRSTLDPQVIQHVDGRHVAEAIAKSRGSRQKRFVERYLQGFSGREVQ